MPKIRQKSRGPKSSAPRFAEKILGNSDAARLI
jgi:hypothetical protein